MHWNSIRQIALWGGLCMACWVVCTRPAQAHRPGDATVQPIVDRAVDYLVRLPKQTWEHECLVGYALIKAGQGKNSPRVQLALETVLAHVRAGLADNDPPHVYPAAITIMFLCDMDDQAYRAEIQHCLDILASRQIDDGSFAYPFQKVGDVSQTQYGVLAYWTADKHGFQVDPARGKRALEYLQACQTADGGFSYQGAFRQDVRSTPSLSAAGGGSLYIIAAWLGYGQDEGAVRRLPEEEGLPPSVRLVRTDQQGRARRAGGDKKIELDEGRLRQAQGRVGGYFGNFPVRIGQWQYYYLYGYERYASFVEASTANAPEEPDWYNKGVDFIRGAQQANGSFTDTMEEPHVHTAFAILFLVRSTKKSLDDGEWSSGALVGGQGLSDDAAIAMRGGRVVSLQVSRDLDDLTAQLEGEGDDSNFANMSGIDSIRLNKDDPEALAQQLVTVRAMVGHPNFDARFLAVRALGQVQTLDNVPVLIYALTDPAEDVVIEANTALKRIARKFADPKFELDEGYNKAALDNVRNNWIEWYLSVRPGASLSVNLQ